MKSLPYYVVTMLAITLIQPCSAELTDVQIVEGQCGKQSHVAEGNIGDDLTKRQSRFYCDSAVITFFDQKSGHVMVQFSEFKAHNNAQLGFAGFMKEDGQIMDVSNVYLDNRQIQVAEGYCKFFFKNKQMDSIACGSAIDEGGRRTVPVIVFTASPGQ